MMKEIPKPVKVVSTLGFLPFACGAAATLTPDSALNYHNDLIVQSALLYAAIILSFLGGTLFGFEINSPLLHHGQIWLSITPPIWALIAVNTPNFTASLLAIGFLLVYEIDRRASSAKKSPAWWLTLRLPLTACVLITLAIMGFNGRG